MWNQASGGTLVDRPDQPRRGVAAPAERPVRRTGPAPAARPAQPGQIQRGQFQPGQIQPAQFQPGQFQPGQFQPGFGPLALKWPGFVAERLTVADPAGWTAAADLVDGDGIESLLTLPQRLWSAPPHAAAVLAWKTYTYRLAQPLATAWSIAREVPLLSADNVLIKLGPERPYVTVGLRRATSAVLATSEAARSHDAIVIPDEAALLDFLRDTLIEGHLRPLLARTQRFQRIGTRALWGQAAAGIAYALAEMSVEAQHDSAVLTRALGLDGLAGVGADDKVWRNTCCLALSTPTLPVCHDCCTLTRRR